MNFSRSQRRRLHTAASTVLAGVLSVALALSDPSGANAATRPDSIRLARATWDTGWFQAEIVRELLIELGYDVDSAQTLENQEFYTAVAAGEVDLWANGWFPLHERYLANVSDAENVAVVGYEVRDGALQGYLVDIETAEEYSIDSLDDLADPRIAALFDADGDGRADLVGCNDGWACAGSIEEHLTLLGLHDTVEQVQGDYSPLMGEAVDRFDAGEPILFYTWTPNWTVGELVPGRHVRWLQLPPNAGPAATPVEAPGCPDAPCRLGWLANDIRIVAHRSFLASNPAIESLLSSIVIPIEDIHRQNALMFSGEDSVEDFRRHARAWIERNRPRVDRWIARARSLQTSVTLHGEQVLPHRPSQLPESHGKLRIATQTIEPFVTYGNRRYGGFSIDLWSRIAEELDLDFELYGVNSLAKLLDDVERGAADLGTAGIGITSQREERLDFSHAYFKSGLQILVREPDSTLLGRWAGKVRSILLTRNLLYVTGVFLVLLLAAAHVIWLVERRKNPRIPESYLPGILEAVWWAGVTVTTVGYGDTTPRRTWGKAFALLWMFAGYFVFAYFTGSVASSFTVQKLQGSIQGPDDLYGRRVGTVTQTPANEYLDGMSVNARLYPRVEEAIRDLLADELDAVVYDAPVLQHYASTEGRGDVHVVGPVFWEQWYGFVLTADSELRDPVNQALLRIIEAGEYREIVERWFGNSRYAAEPGEYVQ